MAKKRNRQNKPNPPQQQQKINRAAQILNKFLQDNDMAIGLTDMPVTRTADGSIVIQKPTIVPIFREDISNTLDKDKKVEARNK